LHATRPNRHAGSSLRNANAASRVSAANVVMDRARDKNNFLPSRCLARIARIGADGATKTPEPKPQIAKPKYRKTGLRPTASRASASLSGSPTVNNKFGNHNRGHSTQLLYRFAARQWMAQCAAAVTGDLPLVHDLGFKVTRHSPVLSWHARCGITGHTSDPAQRTSFGK
jgi:hypothetical protein